MILILATCALGLVGAGVLGDSRASMAQYGVQRLCGA